MTREAILDAAASVLAHDRDALVRIEDVAHEAGVSRATFYNHFADRQELLAALLERLLGESDEDPNARSALPPLEEIRNVSETAARRMLQDEDLARLVYTMPIRHEALLKPEETTTPFVFRRIHALVEHGVEDGQIRTDVNIEVLCAHVHSALETAMRAWAEGRTDDPVVRLRVLLDLAFEGISAPLPPSAGG